MSPVLNYHEFPVERKASQEQGMETEAIYIKHMDEENIVHSGSLVESGLGQHGGVSVDRDVAQT